MFQLTLKETEILVSQNAIPSKKHLGGYLPYAFTEQGVASAIFGVIRQLMAPPEKPKGKIRFHGD